MNYLDIDTEVNRLARAMVSQDYRIAQDLLNHLQTYLSADVVAGIVLICLERLLQVDQDAVLWTVTHLVPMDLLREIQKLVSLSFYRRLIDQGFEPGEDFSVDAKGHLLLSSQAHTAVFV